MSGSDQPQRQVLRLHGRDHRPGGSDPIPGLGLSWAYISSDGNPVDCPPSTTTRIAADASNFYTNAPSVFDAHTSGGGVMGMRLLADGHYLFWMTAGVDVGVIPVAGDIYQLIAEGGGEFSDFGWQPSPILEILAGVVTGPLVTGGVMNVGDFITAPTDPIVCRIDNTGGGHTLSFFYTGLLVIQLDTISTDLN